MTKSFKYFNEVLYALIFFIPITVIKIGSNLGTSIQWVFFRYQNTVYGDGWFEIYKDFGYVTSGLYTGKSAYSVLLWVVGTILVCIPIALLIFKQKNKYLITRISGLFIIIGGFLFLISTILQYGYNLNGPAGLCIPIGLPAIIIIGIVIYSNYFYQSTEQE